MFNREGYPQAGSLGGQAHHDERPFLAIANYFVVRLRRILTPVALSFSCRAFTAFKFTPSHFSVGPCAALPDCETVQGLF